MADYAGNSDRARETAVDHDPIPETKVKTAVAKGRAGTPQQPKSWLGRTIDKLVKSETGEDLEGYFMRSISDMVCHGIGTIGDLIADTINIKLTGKPSRSRSNHAGARVSYRQYYEDDEDDEYYHGYRKRKKAATVENYADIVFDTKGDAEVVLERMFELLDRFEAVSVADLFDLAGMKHEYQTNKYGWTDLENARVERTRDGYVLALPKVTSL